MLLRSCKLNFCLQLLVGNYQQKTRACFDIRIFHIFHLYNFLTMSCPPPSLFLRATQIEKRCTAASIKTLRIMYYVF